MSKRIKVYLPLFIFFFLIESAYSKGSLIDTSKFVILKADSSQQYFNPTKNQLKRLFKKVVKNVEKGTDKKMDDYVLQIVPKITWNGDRIIVVRGMCQFDTNGQYNWKKYNVYIEDGGDCFFTARYNLSKSRKFTLDFNSDS